jgi:hypothetical protein
MQVEVEHSISHHLLLTEIPKIRCDQLIGRNRANGALTQGMGQAQGGAVTSSQETSVTHVIRSGLICSS